MSFAAPTRDYPTSRIVTLAKAMARSAAQDLASRSTLTVAEWRVLQGLAAWPDGLTVGQIADMAWVDRAEVSRAATALEKRGLIKKQKTPRDRRAPTLILTGTGRECYQPLLAARDAFHGSLLKNLRGDEIAALHLLLDKIEDGLRALSSEENGSVR